MEGVKKMKVDLFLEALIKCIVFALYRRNKHMFIHRLISNTKLLYDHERNDNVIALMDIHTYLLLESVRFLEPLLRNRIMMHIGICIGKEIVPRNQNTKCKCRPSHFSSHPFLNFKSS
jgi:hypothetical protein